MKIMQNALVILAGGNGKRFRQKIPKQFFKIGNQTIIDIFLSNLDDKPFKYIVLSINKNYRNIIKNNKKYNSFKNKVIFSTPGRTRQKSSFNALKKLEKINIQNVLIHDGARPLCSNKLINNILLNLNKKNNCIPYVNSNDRQIINSKNKDVKVSNLQTPQGFKFKLIFNAHKKFKNNNFSDDSSLIQELNSKLNLIKGEITNVKITYPEDLIYLKLLLKPTFKTGIGYDIHRIDKKTKKGLRLCGIKIPFSKLVGHSDADVGLHAICDSIFGALSMRDIGYHFPNNNKKWKNANSSKFIYFCKELLKKENFIITNLDINIIAEKPNISRYVNKMKKNVSKLLSINSNIISIKATTNEKIGFIGNGEGIAAEAIVQISNEIFY